MMKRSLWVLALVVALAFGVGSAGAQELSVGYQGLIGTGSNLLSGISVRGWSDAFGYEGTFFYGHADVDGPDLEADIWILDAKLMYAAVIRENSKFYVGADFAYGQYDIDDFTDDNLWMAGPMLGAEYSFQGLPELGFNWEVGYNFINVDIDDMDAELKLDGINVTAGVHYRF
ncbi:MAG: hypothetical protein R6U50_09545 [Desulfobacterales bacterium]